MLAELSPYPVRQTNQITTLRNGDQIFPAMLDAIASAERSVYFENYAWWAGTVADRFTEAFCESARAGVRVQVVVDWFGSLRGRRRTWRQMRDAGVDLQRFHSPASSLRQLNHRTHRKLLIVDGRVGFIGGVCIADDWLGGGMQPHHRRDNHYRVEGPIVDDLQAVFCERLGSKQVKSERPPHPAASDLSPRSHTGGLACQLVASSGNDDENSTRSLFETLLRHATTRVDIGTAYLSPGRQTLELLCETARRGVELRMVVPGPHIDHKVTGAAMRGLFQPLLDAGVRLYEYQPAMYHTKMMIVDEQTTVIGSANLDERSMRHNEEAVLVVYDADFAREQRQWLERDLEHCKHIDARKWRSRNPFLRAWQWAATSLRNQL
jgi:cardiolipin synthase